MIPNFRAFFRWLRNTLLAFLELLRPGKTFIAALIFPVEAELSKDGLGFVTNRLDLLLAVGPIRLRRGETVILRREVDWPAYKLGESRLLVADPGDFYIKSVKFQKDDQLMSGFPLPATLFDPTSIFRFLGGKHSGGKFVVEVEVCR